MRLPTIRERIKVRLLNLVYRCAYGRGKLEITEPAGSLELFAGPTYVEDLAKLNTCVR